jgi:hypothetical protein
MPEIHRIDSVASQNNDMHNLVLLGLVVMIDTCPYRYGARDIGISRDGPRDSCAHFVAVRLEIRRYCTDFDNHVLFGRESCYPSPHGTGKRPLESQSGEVQSKTQQENAQTVV